MCAVLGMTLLAGCSTSWLPSWPSWPSSAPVPQAAATRWVCDSQVEVFWQYTDAARSKVDVRLGGQDQVYHLKAEPGADGQMFSDGVLAFHIKDNQGLVYWVATNDLIGRGCKAP
jgi:hypothetical protein